MSLAAARQSTPAPAPPAPPASPKITPASALDGPPTFAMSGNEDASVKSFTGYYKALWNSDLLVDFIEPQSLESHKYKVIIAPWHLIGKKETFVA